MTPEERQLISGLFDRMRNIGNLDKDREADALIAERVRAMPDAPYMLVQSVLVQEQALQQAERRIRELEEDLRDLESEDRAPARGGGFLGGLFGGGQPAAQPSTSSVPPVGSRSRGFPPPREGDRPGLGAFGSPQQRASAGGGGFMQQAMSTAAGVAGGMLAAGAIRDLLGGGSSAQASTGGKEGAGGGDATTQQAGKDGTGGEDKNVQNASNDQSEKDRQQDNYQDAQDDDAGGWDDGGDYEI